MISPVSLQPVEEEQVADLLRFFTDPELCGEYEWFGYRGSLARELEARWEEDALLGEESGFLAVHAVEEVAGWVTWRPAGRSGNHEIGAALFPEFRGRRIGTEAQRQLVEHLFGTTVANRIQAETEVDNVAEQRALERIGFRQEGRIRGLSFRAGRWRDVFLYGPLRDEFGPHLPA